MSKIHAGLDIGISVAASDDLDSILALQKIAFLSEAALIDDYTIPPLKQDITESGMNSGTVTFSKLKSINRSSVQFERKYMEEPV